MHDGGARITGWWYGVSAAVVALDQWTKQWAERELLFGHATAVTPWFDLTLAYNRGAAFSFLHDMGGWQRWFFATIAALVSLVIIAWLWRLGSRQKVLALGLALILGGALGNLYDRLALGHVVDFISLHYGPYYWPAFNVADSAITCGALLLIIDMLLQGRVQKEGGDGA